MLDIFFVLLALAFLAVGSAFRTRLRSFIGASMGYVLAGLIALALAVYLLYALMRPERF